MEGRHEAGTACCTSDPCPPLHHQPFTCQSHPRWYFTVSSVTGVLLHSQRCYRQVLSALLFYKMLFLSGIGSLPRELGVARCSSRTQRHWQPRFRASELVGTRRVTTVDTAQQHTTTILAAGRPVCRQGWFPPALCLTSLIPLLSSVVQTHRPLTFNSATPPRPPLVCSPLHL